ncbi:MAG TPA: bacillithiol biosynthesis deacetylase BshB1 [Bacilli bacterium]
MGMSLDILVFGAHPDDAEIGMGGTIRKHTNAGYKVGICDLTLAEMSSNGTVESRRREAESAGSILKLHSRTNLELPDRGLFMCKEHIELITREIRKFQPRLVFAPYWQDRHPDHEACSRLVEEAVFNAKLRKYLPDIPSFQVEQFIYYFINDVYEPDMVLDVSPFYNDKQAALREYKSQFDPVSSHDRVKTPINQRYLERIETRDRLMGQQQAVEYAEGFVSKQPTFINLF